MDIVVKMMLNGLKLRKYDAIASRMHRALYGTVGEGTFGDRLERILQIRSYHEVFSTVDETKLHPEAALCLYTKHDRGESYYSSFLRQIGDQTKKIVEFLDFLDDQGVSIPCEEQLIKYKGLLHDDIIAHPYWDRRRDQFLEYLGELRADSRVAKQIRERIDLTASTTPVIPPEKFTTDRIAALVSQCQKEGSLIPLQTALKSVETRTDKLAINALTDVQTAYGELKGTFWEVRELVNALNPGSYPYPLQKPQASKPFSLKSLFQALNLMKPPEQGRKDLDPLAQFRSAISKTGRNIASIDKALDSLYAINRKGGEQSDVINSVTESITGYLDTAVGKSLEQADPIMYDMLKSTKVSMQGSRTKLDYARSFSEGLARRALPVRDTLSGTMSGINVTMTLQTAKAVVSHEGYLNNFYGAAEKLADICVWMTTDLAVNAPLLKDTGATLAAQMIDDANNFQATMADYRANLKESRDPATPMERPSRALN